MKTLDLNIVGGEQVQLEQQEALKFRYGWLNDKESKWNDGVLGFFVHIV